tara:strand:- start:401 stop:751 length:351 start_codon:yes stop_codon:yes gene_type:complete
MKKLLLGIFMMSSIILQATELKNFEGLWKSKESTYYVAILHKGDKVEFVDFSFLTGQTIEENIVTIGEDYIITAISYEVNNHHVQIKYTLVDENTIKCEFSGSTDVVNYYKRVKLN